MSRARVGIHRIHAREEVNVVGVALVSVVHPGVVAQHKTLPARTASVRLADADTTRPGWTTVSLNQGPGDENGDPRYYVTVADASGSQFGCLVPFSQLYKLDAHAYTLTTCADTTSSSPVSSKANP